MIKAHRLAGLAALFLVGSVTPARAIPVTYSTSGVFGSSGMNLLSQDGAQIRFNNLASTTVAAPATAVTLDDTFTLTITQTAPGPGNLVFTSTVGGSIFLGNSQAFVQFNTPLTRTITSGGFTTSYRIVEGDDANPGRLELFGGVGQISTLNGEIGITGTGVVPIPEPGTMALACAALPLLGLGYLRRRRQNA